MNCTNPPSLQPSANFSSSAISLHLDRRKRITGRPHNICVAANHVGTNPREHTYICGPALQAAPQKARHQPNCIFYPSRLPRCALCETRSRDKGRPLNIAEETTWPATRDCRKRAGQQCRRRQRRIPRLQGESQARV